MAKHRRRARRNERGMTLIETIVASIISAVLITGVAAAVTVVVRSEEKIDSTIGESHDLDQLISYLPRDVQAAGDSPAAYSTAPNQPSGCAGSAEPGTNVLWLGYTDATANLQRVVGYRATTLNGATRLDRYTCTRGTDGVYAAASIANVADRLPGDASAIDVTITEAAGLVTQVTIKLTTALGEERQVSASPQHLDTSLPAVTTTVATTVPTTAAPTTVAPTTAAPTTAAPTTVSPTTAVTGTTVAPTTVAPTTAAPTTAAPTTAAPTTVPPTTVPASICPNNPMRYVSRFQAFIRNNVTLNQLDAYTAIALGGNLNWTGPYNITPRSTTAGFTASGDSRNTGLLVGGRLEFTASSGQMTLNSTYLHVGNFTNGRVGTGNSNETNVLPSGTATTPEIFIQNWGQTATGTNPIQRSGLVDFNSAFTNIITSSNGIETLPGCTGSVALTMRGVNGVGNYIGSGPVWFEYQANKVNVWNTTVAQLNAMGNINKTPASAALNVNTTVLINVLDSGSISFAPPVYTQNDVNYVLWNFPNATSVTINSTPIWGSVLAPSAHVTTNTDIRGSLIAARWTANNGSLDWDRRWAGRFPWDNTYTPF